MPISEAANRRRRAESYSQAIHKRLLGPRVRPGDEDLLESRHKGLAASVLAGMVRPVKFSELIRLIEQNGFRLVKEKGSVRYYSKAGHPA